MTPEKTITIVIEGGCLVDVSGLPDGWDYELIDHDNLDAEDAETDWERARE